MQRRRALGISLVVASLTSIGLSSPSRAAATAPLRFGTPIRLTQPNFGGYEPGIQVDRFGNIYVTAHKQNHIDGLAPDGQSPTQVRSASWLWTSADGVHFQDMPGLTALSLNNENVGDEGDLALDQADNLYFVDTNVKDVTFSRWHISGKGAQTFQTAPPVVGALETLNDRPWVSATGDGVVYYFGNEGDKTTYPLAAQGQGARGPGRFTVYMSYDHGTTWDHIGYQFADSGWCRPAPDGRPGSHTMYLICSNDSGADDNVHNPGDAGYTVGTLWAYVSHDDGHTWARHAIGHYDGHTTGTWPSAMVDGNGHVSTLYVDHIAKPRHDVLEVFTSVDGGLRWTKRIVPTVGNLIPYSTIAVSHGGTIAATYFGRPDATSPWYLYAGELSRSGSFPSTQVAAIASPNGMAWGDFYQAAFGPDNKLNLTWTADGDLAGSGNTTSLNSDIYYAKQL